MKGYLTPTGEKAITFDDDEIDYLITHFEDVKAKLASMGPIKSTLLDLLKAHRAGNITKTIECPDLVETLNEAPLEVNWS